MDIGSQGMCGSGNRPLPNRQAATLARYRLAERHQLLWSLRSAASESIG